MSDNQEELRKRFSDRVPGSDDETDDSGHTDTTDSASDPGQADPTDDTNDLSNTGDTATSQQDASDKPGPDPSDDATRSRRQVPMYLPEPMIEDLNEMYEQLDAKSKLEGQGGIEKHKDFIETVVELALESEDEIADRLDIPT